MNRLTYYLTEYPNISITTPLSIEMADIAASSLFVVNDWPGNEKYRFRKFSVHNTPISSPRLRGLSTRTWNRSFCPDVWTVFSFPLALSLELCVQKPSCPATSPAWKSVFLCLSVLLPKLRSRGKHDLHYSLFEAWVKVFEIR